MANCVKVQQISPNTLPEALRPACTSYISAPHGPVVNRQEWDDP